MDNNIKEKQFWPKFWSFAGKTSVILGIIWLIIEIGRYLFNDNFSAEVLATYTEVPQIKKITDNQKDILQYEFVVKNINRLKLPFDSTIIVDSNIVKQYVAEHQSYFDSYFISYAKKYSVDKFYTYKISNNGEKPIEDINITLPFAGEYEMLLQDNQTKNGLFENRIIIGTLNPSYSVTVYIWSNSLLIGPIFSGEKGSVNHKYGTFEVEYPVISRGLTARLLKMDWYYFFMFTLLIFYLLFWFFYAKYSNKKASENATSDQTVSKNE